jgi:CheY-like chemotaxis protein
MAPILIVSHEAGATSFIASALREAGYTTATATSGPEALKAAALDAYAVIVIEILMPEFDGVETIMALRMTDCQATILAMAGQGRLVSAGDALNLAKAVGANATLTKPFSEEAIVSLVASLLAAKA